MKDRLAIETQPTKTAHRPKIIRVIARLNVGGPAKHVVWLTRGLRSEFNTLLVAGTVPRGEEDMNYFATEMGVAPIFVPEMSREVSLKDFFSIWKLYGLFLREQPDIVHTHTAKAGTVGRAAGFFYRWLTFGSLAGRPRACKFIHTYHGHIFHSYYGPAKTRLFLIIEKILARIVTDRIVVISQQQRQEINEQFGVGRAEQIAVVPLGLDTQKFAQWKERRNNFRDELKVKPEEIVIGIVGRLTEIKNHQLFLEAVALFKNQFPDLSRQVRFVVLGDGHLRTELEQQASAAGISSDLFFAGSRRDPENFYPGLDIVALTSRNEGTPLTLIEAMANARAVISTGVGGVIDLLGEANAAQPNSAFVVCERGLQIRPDDANGLAAGLAHLVMNQALRREIGNRGLQFVTENYSIERLLRDIRDLYAELLATKEDGKGFAGASPPSRR